MTLRIFSAIALLTIAMSRDGAPLPALAGTCADSSRLTVEPAVPKPGAMFLVRLSKVASGTQLSGEIARQALHFVPESGGGAVSFAAVPIEADSGTLEVAVLCSHDAAVDTLRTSVTLSRANYPVERLRVAPGFGREPDSALAARIRRESERAREVAEVSHATQGLWQGPWQLPRASRITSGFGRGREYNGAITSRHMGTDFAGATGAVVRAANRGVVRIVDAFYYGGNVVYVDHGGGVTSAYLHLSRQDVAVGDTVERGTPLGLVGATGRVTGPHLHLILRYGGITVDPLSLFALVGDSTARRVAGAAR